MRLSPHRWLHLWLCAAVLASSLHARAEFSHRVHLAAKVQCVVCHSGAQSSKAASDSLLPAAEVCLNCHPGTTPQIKPVRQLTVTKFNHSLHVKLGPVIAGTVAKAVEAKKYLGPADAASRARQRHACTGCHTGLEQSDAVSEAAFPHMADCLTCHTDIDPPFSCAKCHTESQRLKPASHVNEWIDLHSSGKTVKDRASCAVCHGRGVTCQGCH